MHLSGITYRKFMSDDFQVTLIVFQLIDFAMILICLIYLFRIFNKYTDFELFYQLCHIDPFFNYS